MVTVKFKTETTTGTEERRAILPRDVNGTPPPWRPIREEPSNAGGTFVRDWRLFSSPGDVKREIEEEFNKLVTQWFRETAHESVSSRMMMYPTFRRLLCKGHSSLPFIFDRLKRKPDARWFLLLHEILGYSPVPDDARGNIRRMAQAWLQWRGRREV